MRNILCSITLTLLLGACGNSVEDKYIASCMIGLGSSSSDAEKLCSCTYDKLESKFGEEKLEEWAKQITPSNQKDANDFAEVGLHAAAQCAREMGFGK